MIEYLKQLGIHNVKPLKGFHNDIYQGVHHDTSIIIRVSERRDLKMVKEEVDLLNLLKKHLCVIERYPVNQREVIEENHKVITFFKRIQGLNWHETTLTNKIHENAGKALGELHLLMTDYKVRFRQHFTEHPDLKLIDNLEDCVKNELKHTLNALSKDQAKNNEYGLIHGDYLYSNLIYQGEDVVIIDFDDIEQHYYLYDIAVYLFYLLLGGKPKQIDISPNIEVFKHFMNGYLSVNQKTVLDFQKLPALFRLRQLKLYATIKTYSKPIGPWQKDYLELCEKQFKAGETFVSMDYSSLFKQLKNT